MSSSRTSKSSQILRENPKLGKDNLMTVVGVVFKSIGWAVYDPNPMLRAVHHLPFLQAFPPVLRQCLKVGIL